MAGTGSSTPAPPETPAERPRWYRRPTVRTLKRQAGEQHRQHSAKRDRSDNEQTRLPDSEEIHLGGLVLTEAFTPSTVSSLYRALEQWPAERPGRRQELLEGLARSRAGGGGGWQSLGLVRQPGQFVLGGGHTDPQLPQGLDAVWLQAHFVTPSLTMIVATFTLNETSGDLGPLLRQDFRSQTVDTSIRVDGRFGDLRARLPWARPAKHGVGYGMRSAEHQKRDACQAMIERHETECREWFEGWFRGRFAQADRAQRPTVRMLFTKENAPYSERHSWLRPVGLDSGFSQWKSTDPVGWWLSPEERWPSDRQRPHSHTLAARRSDATTQPTDKEDDGSNWHLTQRFAADHTALAAHLGVRALLSLYNTRLGELRDRAGKKRVVRQPVRDARNLGDYLIGDGLDAATVTADIDLVTQDPEFFRWDLPEFIEHREQLAADVPEREPLDFVTVLRDDLRARAARLASDTRKTTENIQASAQLSQAIANTRLQRVVLVLSAAAAVIALISLLGA